MGKSTSQKTTENSSSTTRNSSPGYVQDASRYLVNTGTNMNEPFLQTPLFGLAGFNPDQMTGMQYGREIAQSVYENPNRWAQNTANLASGFGSLPGYTPGNAAEWANPYMETVANKAMAGMERDYRDKDASLAASYAAGPVQGSGAAIARGQLARGSNEAAGQMQAQLRAQAYDDAQNRSMQSTQIARENLMQNRNDQFRAQTQGSALDNDNLQRNLMALQMYQGIGQNQQDFMQRAIDLPWDALARLQSLTPQDQSGLSQTVGQSTKKTESSGGGSAISGLAGLASIAKSFGLICDRRLKTDIEELGVDAETGLMMYAFRYKSDPKTHPKTYGPMADEVEARYPGSTRIVAGYRVIQSIPQAQAA
jgi:hypothetical protein